MSSREIFVVEDDPAVRQTLSVVLSAAGYEVICFLDGDALLATARKRYPLCILLDLHLPGKSGLEILRELSAEHYPAPVFMISGHGTIDLAMQAVRDGAVDFIQKPFRGAELVGRIETALERETTLRASRVGNVPPLNVPGQTALTNREREILTQTLLGKSTKEMSRLYGISPRTVEDHRSNIKRKTGAKTVIELVRAAIGAQTFDSLVTATAQKRSKRAGE
jgi:FixJ family two-component response regulator